MSNAKICIEGPKGFAFRILEQHRDQSTVHTVTGLHRGLQYGCRGLCQLLTQGMGVPILKIVLQMAWSKSSGRDASDLARCSPPPPPPPPHTHTHTHKWSINEFKKISWKCFSVIVELKDICAKIRFFPRWYNWWTNDSAIRMIPGNNRSRGVYQKLWSEKERRKKEVKEGSKHGSGEKKWLLTGASAHAPPRGSQFKVITYFVCETCGIVSRVPTRLLASACPDLLFQLLSWPNQSGTP